MKLSGDLSLSYCPNSEFQVCLYCDYSSPASCNWQHQIQRHVESPGVDLDSASLRLTCISVSKLIKNLSFLVLELLVLDCNNALKIILPQMLRGFGTCSFKVLG